MELSVVNNQELFNIITDEERKDAIGQIKEMKKAIKNMSIDQLKKKCC